MQVSTIDSDYVQDGVALQSTPSEYAFHGVNNIDRQQFRQPTYAVSEYQLPDLNSWRSAIDQGNSLYHYVTPNELAPLASSSSPAPGNPTLSSLQGNIVSSRQLKKHINDLDAGYYRPAITNGALYFIPTEAGTRTARSVSDTNINTALELDSDAIQNDVVTARFPVTPPPGKSDLNQKLSLAQLRDLLGADLFRQVMYRYRARSRQSPASSEHTSRSSLLRSRNRSSSDVSTCLQPTYSSSDVSTAGEPTIGSFKSFSNINTAIGGPRSSASNVSTAVDGVRSSSDVSTCAEPSARSFSRYNRSRSSLCGSRSRPSSSNVSTASQPTIGSYKSFSNISTAIERGPSNSNLSTAYDGVRSSSDVSTCVEPGSNFSSFHSSAPTESLSSNLQSLLDQADRRYGGAPTSPAFSSGSINVNVLEPTAARSITEFNVGDNVRQSSQLLDPRAVGACSQGCTPPSNAQLQPALFGNNSSGKSAGSGSNGLRTATSRTSMTSSFSNLSI